MLTVQDLHLKHHELVEIGDTVSICSAVTLLPSAAQGAAKISIMGGADVTNQTALYPGVTVKPGAVLGVFTYAEAGRTFPCHSITQVNAASGCCDHMDCAAPLLCPAVCQVPHRKRSCQTSFTTVQYCTPICRIELVAQ